MCTSFPLVIDVVEVCGIGFMAFLVSSVCAALGSILRPALASMGRGGVYTTGSAKVTPAVAAGCLVYLAACYLEPSYAAPSAAVAAFLLGWYNCRLEFDESR